jgi:transketolase
MEESFDKPFNEELKASLAKIAATIRGLTIDATERANSGHPGLPLGCAELGAYLYGYFLRYSPKEPLWPGRDRFILSAGHGSMLLYSCLFLSGYDLSLDDIRAFRKLHSKTPGHPESRLTPGVETTTGPLGQGFTNACGMALGLKILGSKFHRSGIELFSSKVVTLVGDGCMMEGMSGEAASLAGHLCLDNLIVIYDANQVCLDGPTSECFSEDVKKRYRAYGWDVTEIDGSNFDEIHRAFAQVRKVQPRPLLIIARTIIGKGSPHKAGSHKVHGSPLGPEEAKLTKAALGLSPEEFYVPQSVLSYFEERRKENENLEQKWSELFEVWGRAFPTLKCEFLQMASSELPKDLEGELSRLEIKGSVSGRKVSHDVLQLLADRLPQLYGGSADLSCSDLTHLEKFPTIGLKSFSGRNIKFGVREAAMCGYATGLAQTRMILPYIGTFLTFSDYMRSSIRLASMMQEQVIYQFTHDSIFLGEDGPTHQPIEQLASLRAIPNLHVIRPASCHEVKMAWIAALKYRGPTAIVLSRQNMREVKGTEVPYHDGVGRGAYIVRKEKEAPQYTLIATGSELALALDVAEELERLSKPVRVISMPCPSLFEMQPISYKSEILGGNIGKRVSIEAGVENGWHKYIGLSGVAISLDTFGASAPCGDLAKEFGFTSEQIIERIL